MPSPSLSASSAYEQEDRTQRYPLESSWGGTEIGRADTRWRLFSVGARKERPPITMRIPTLFALSVLLPVVSLVQCRVAAPSEEAAPSNTVVAASAGATLGASVVTGTASIWLSDSRERAEEKLADVRALNLGSVSVSSRRDLLTGVRTARGERILEQVRATGVKVWIHPHEYARDELEAVTGEQYRAAGRAWGALACRYPDVVAGFYVQNEYDLPVRRARQNSGEATSEAVARLHARVIIAYAEGVKEACPSVPVYAGPVAFPQRSITAYTLSFLADALAAGTLDGVGANVYRHCGEFAPATAGPGELRAREPISPIFDAMLEGAGLPSDTRIHIAEANVARLSCRSDEAAARTLSALLYELSADPRVVRVSVFSPWPPGNDDVAEQYTIRPGTPVGNAVAAWAEAPTSPR